jgi:hypothetical protein
MPNKIQEYNYNSEAVLLCKTLFMTCAMISASIYDTFGNASLPFHGNIYNALAVPLFSSLCLSAMPLVTPEEAEIDVVDSVGFSLAIGLELIQNHQWPEDLGIASRLLNGVFDVKDLVSICVGAITWRLIDPAARFVHDSTPQITQPLYDFLDIQRED